jgi:hypothetical protein
MQRRQMHGSSQETSKTGAIWAMAVVDPAVHDPEPGCRYLSGSSKGGVREPTLLMIKFSGHGGQKLPIRAESQRGQGVERIEETPGGITEGRGGRSEAQTSGKSHQESWPCSRRVGRREETERFEDRKMGWPSSEIIFCL